LDLSCMHTRMMREDIPECVGRARVRPKTETERSNPDAGYLMLGMYVCVVSLKIGPVEFEKAV
jgi:hypothetical protein